MKPLSEARYHLYNALDWIRVGNPESARERIQEAVYILEDHDHLLANAPKPEEKACETCDWGIDSPDEQTRKQVRHCRACDPFKKSGWVRLVGEP